MSIKKDLRENKIHNFLENILNIKKYNLTFFGFGKDNVTCLVKSDFKEFVIQMHEKMNYDQRDLIEKVISHLKDNNFSFAGKVFEKRFYDYEGKVFQVMEYLGGECFVYDDLSFDKILEVTSDIARLHNCLDCKKFEDYSYGTSNFKDVFGFIELSKKYNMQDKTNSEQFEKLFVLTKGLELSSELRRGVIHGDEVLKNILFDSNKDIIGYIDYEMIGYEDYLWGFVDYIRNFMKTESFGKKEFFQLVDEYEKVRPFTKKEKNNLENYLKLMILNTGFRYFLSLFEGSGYNNLYTSSELNSYSKIDNCIKEFNKAHLFFNEA